MQRRAFCIDGDWHGAKGEAGECMCQAHAVKGTVCDDTAHLFTLPFVEMTWPRDGGS
jgi:hypothetical protein